MRKLKVPLVVLAAVALLAAVPDAALAAGASDIGKNVGREVSSWARAIMLGVAGLVAIPLLARRDVAGGLVLALLVVIVGGFVFAPSTVESAITGLWHAIAG
jgi:xanthine dehydrogenase iron-sulfur cluster and FAD-binding subunit A